MSETTVYERLGGHDAICTVANIYGHGNRLNDDTVCPQRDPNEIRR